MDSKDLGPEQYGKWLWIGLGVAVALGVVFLMNRSVTTEQSLAIIPFVETQVSKPALQDFTDQIHDSLSRIPNLRVITRGSVVEGLKAGSNATELGRRLWAGAVLSGAVTRADQRLHVEARLEQASSGAILWSRKFEGNLDDPGALRLEITKAVAGSLQLDSSAVASQTHRSIDVEAQDLYARAFLADGKTAILLLRRALKLAPDFQEARVEMARLKMQYDWDWAGAEQDLKLVTSSRSSAQAELNYGCLLVRTGRFSQAKKHLMEARAIDPLGIPLQIASADCEFLSGRAEDAERQLQRLAAAWPESAQVHFARANVLATYRPAEALPLYRKFEGRIAGSTLLEALALALAKRKPEALALLANASVASVPRFWLAAVNTALGQREAALRLLDESATLREAELTAVAVHPWFVSLREDPGFQILLARMRLPKI